MSPELYVILSSLLYFQSSAVSVYNVICTRARIKLLSLVSVLVGPFTLAFLSSTAKSECLLSFSSRFGEHKHLYCIPGAIGVLSLQESYIFLNSSYT